MGAALRMCPFSRFDFGDLSGLAIGHVSPARNLQPHGARDAHEDLAVRASLSRDQSPRAEIAAAAARQNEGEIVPSVFLEASYPNLVAPDHQGVLEHGHSAFAPGEKLVDEPCDLARLPFGNGVMARFRGGLFAVMPRVVLGVAHTVASEEAYGCHLRLSTCHGFDRHARELAESPPVLENGRGIGRACRSLKGRGGSRPRRDDNGRTGDWGNDGSLYFPYRLEMVIHLRAFGRRELFPYGVEVLTNEVDDTLALALARESAGRSSRARTRSG